MSKIYYCELCEQKYIENQEKNTRIIYTERVPDLNKTKPINKNCRVCSKLFGVKYGTITWRI
tara:strand:- start:639 stop:824 length:186 start_codon:yes stop_codon:yes gene_type:complete